MRLSRPVKTATAILLAVLAFPGPAGAAATKQDRDAEAIERARVALRDRGVTAGFALVARDGRVVSRRGAVPHPLGSVTKSMLAIAYLDQPRRRGRELSDKERRLLTPMIVESSNPEAETVYRAVGDHGLRAVARRAGMSRFYSSHVRYGYTWGWGAATASALDLAHLFMRVDRLAPERHRPFLRTLLKRVEVSQRWGIPAAAGTRWRTYFKGGWGDVGPAGIPVNQAALLSRGGRRAALAIVTAGSPSYDAAGETIEAVAAALLPRG